MTNHPIEPKGISKFLYYFKQAIKGGEHDFTSGSINKAIFLLSVPMVLEMLMESLFAVVDIYFVGKISVNAVATVALTESVVMIIYALAIGFSMAATAVVARRIGEKKPKEASEAAMQSVVLCFGVSVLLGIIGAIFAKDILRLMGGEEQLIEEGYRYTMIILGGNTTIFFLFLINAIFRGAGDASIAMRVLILSNGLNIILDPLLIFGLGSFEGFGIQGAAIATTTGRGIAVLYQLYKLSSGDSVIKVVWNKFKLQIDIIKNLINIAMGGIGQYMIGTLSWLFLVRISAEFGSEVLAGYAIAFRVIMFTILPSWGLANAAATLVGQNLGAQKPERAEQSVWKSAFYNMIFLSLIAVVFIVWAEHFIVIFSSEPEVIRIGAIALRYIGFGYVFFAYGMVIGQAFNGAGDTKTPTIINFFVFWMFEIPLAYFLAVTLDFGPKGIFSAIAVAVTVLAIVCIIVFKRGKWKEVKV